MTNAAQLAELFARRGARLFAVGGMVRNPLIGLPATDFDVTSRLTPREVISLCREEDIKHLDIGAPYGMVELHYEGEAFQHTTFRRDTYPTGGGHRPRRVEYSTDINEDAFRRDFTVNAIYRDLISGEIIDPTGGMSDLESGLLRTTSPDPAVIMSDDALRILRLARFSAELGLSAEGRTLEAAKAASNGLNNISPERIREELNKILLSDAKYGICCGVLRGLTLLDETRSLDVILPELARGRGLAQKPQYHRYDVLEHCFRTAECIEPVMELRLAALLHDVGKPYALEMTGRMYSHEVIGAELTEIILKRLKYPAETIRIVAELVRHHMYDLSGLAREDTLRLWLQQRGIRLSLGLIALRRADVHGSGIITGAVETADRWEHLLKTMISEGVPFDERQLDITGEEICEALGIAPSPKVGRIKQTLLRHCAKAPADNKKRTLLRLCRDMVNNS